MLHVIFARDDYRMVVYGYKPDTLVAVYPALQGKYTLRCNIFKNTAVYPADWLAENYRHYLKVRLICQQLQMVQRAELVSFAPPRPTSLYKSSPHWCGWSKQTLTAAECLLSSISSITPVTIKPVKMHSQRLPISSLFTSVVFMSMKFTRLLLRFSSLSTRHACGGTRPAFWLPC